QRRQPGHGPRTSAYRHAPRRRDPRAAAAARRARCAAPRPPQAHAAMSRFPQNLDALDATEPYDVCIIGAGAAGSIAALCLARAGLRVLLIEGAPLPHGRVRPAPPAIETELAGDTYRAPRAGASEPP